MPSLAGYDEYTSSLYKEKFGVAPPQDFKDA